MLFAGVARGLPPSIQIITGRVDKADKLQGKRKFFRLAVHTGIVIRNIIKQV